METRGRAGRSGRTEYYLQRARPVRTVIGESAMLKKITILRRRPTILSSSDGSARGRRQGFTGKPRENPPWVTGPVPSSLSLTILLARLANNPRWMGRRYQERSSIGGDGRTGGTRSPWGCFSVLAETVCSPVDPRYSTCQAFPPSICGISYSETGVDRVGGFPSVST